MSAFRPRNFSSSRMANPRTIGVSRSSLQTLKKNVTSIDWVRPSWQSESVFRILPGVVNNGGKLEFDQCRVSVDEGKYGSAWSCCFEAVRNFGDPGITMFLSNGDPSYHSYSQNPAWILYRAIKDAVDRKQAKAEWYPLFNRAGNRPAPLSKPQDICLAQALVFRYKDQNQFGAGKPPYGFAAEDPTIILELSTSASQALFGELEKRRDDWDGSPNDPEAFVWPDITGIDQGAFVHFYTLGKDPREAQSMTSEEVDFDPYAATPQHKLSSGKTTEGIGFGCFLTNDLDGNAKIHPRLVGHDKKVMAKVRPWEDILEFHDDVKQAHILNKLFPASAIEYAFSDHPEWILPEIRSKAVNAVSVSLSPNRPVAKVNSAEDIYGSDDTTDTGINNTTFGVDDVLDDASTDNVPSIETAAAEVQAAKERAAARKRIHAANQ